MAASVPRQPTGVLYRVDSESLNTLIEQYVTSLSTNASEQERVEKLKQEYVTVKSKVVTLPQQLEYDALVPFGRRAVCPGKIIHTNEITCLLGDNWFVECSASKAVEIINHRIAKLDEQHESLRKEQELINNWKQEAERQLIETIGHGTVEIREDYEEEREKKWQQQHRENVRRHHQQLAKQRLEAKQEKGKSEVDRDLWIRLDELEIQEELEDYLEQESMTEEKVSNVVSYLSQPTKTEIRSQKVASENQKPLTSPKDDTPVPHDNSCSGSASDTKPEKTEINTTKTTDASSIIPSHRALEGKRRVKFSSDNIIHDISDDINQDNYNNQEEKIQVSVPSSLLTDDDSSMPTYPRFEPIIIRFRHSTPADVEDGDTNTSGTEEEVGKLPKVVANPGDIVKTFGPTSISAISNKPLPKSILKPFAPPLVTDNVRSAKNKSGKDKKSTGGKPSSTNEDLDGGGEEDMASAISKVVTERLPIFTSLQLNTKTLNEPDSNSTEKPVSLFKMRRQHQNQLVTVTSPD